ncbi:CapA family protein [Rhabdothermincola salaria]|uniref:CapA family protein n=1 Tax=Rhabdothermincola salaria TaxID=2903142 RepID=UPI0024B4CBD5|nr:CapA family protein [Rhabdothermincola salaria]
MRPPPSDRRRPGRVAGRTGALLAALLLIVGAACSSDASTGAPAGTTLGADQTASTATSTTPPTTATTTTTAPPPRSLSLLTTGDLLLHMPVQRQALAYGGGTYDFTPMFADIADEIAGSDFAICHMEAPLSPDNQGLSGYPMFHSSRDIADAAAAVGFDACSTASNHSLDQGPAGVVATLDQLDRVGLGHAGTNRSAEEAATPRLHDVNGVRLAHLAYTYGTNGIPVPADQPWLVELIDIDTILADAATARAAGAELVVVEMHWGDEYVHLPNATQRAQAAQLLASPDIDVLIGQHVHVVQAAERIGDEYVVYGTGNLLSNQGAPATPTASNDGVLVHVDLTENPDGTWSQAVRYTPTYVERGPFVVRRAAPGSDSYQRTVAALGGLGPGTFDGTPTS